MYVSDSSTPWLNITISDDKCMSSVSFHFVLVSHLHALKHTLTHSHPHTITYLPNWLSAHVPGAHKHLQCIPANTSFGDGRPSSRHSLRNCLEPTNVYKCSEQLIFFSPFFVWLSWQDFSRLSFVVDEGGVMSASVRWSSCGAASVWQDEDRETHTALVFINTGQVVFA